MRAVIQRVIDATLSVVEDGAERAHPAIGPGLVALVGIEHDDEEPQLAWLATKIANLRVFQDDDGRMNRSLIDRSEAGEPAAVLLVPNFTVAGRARKGRRPDFTTAKPPAIAEPMFERLAGLLREAAPRVDVRTGVFGAHMHVALVNDGPVTIWLDTRE